MSFNSFKKGDYVKIRLKNNDIYKGNVLHCDETAYEICNFEFNGQLQERSLMLYRTEIENIYLLSNNISKSNNNNSRENDQTQFKLTEVEYGRFLKIIENPVYITAVGDEFKRSLHQLGRCQSVGVSGFGIRNDNSTHLSILAITTNNEIFIYDILWMKTLDQLKMVLESPYITKIVHNGKPLYKHLRKYYNIKINNIFDVQVADSMISARDESQDITRSLSECIAYRYNFPELFYDEQVNSTWHQRPLDRSDRLLIGNVVVFLRKLRDDLQNVLLSDFHDSIQNIHQEYIKKTDFDLVFTKATNRRSK